MLLIEKTFEVFSVGRKKIFASSKSIGRKLSGPIPRPGAKGLHFSIRYLASYRFEQLW